MWKHTTFLALGAGIMLAAIWLPNIPFVAPVARAITESHSNPVFERTEVLASTAVDAPSSYASVEQPSAEIAVVDTMEISAPQMVRIDQTTSIRLLHVTNEVSAQGISSDLTDTVRSLESLLDEPRLRDATAEISLFSSGFDIQPSHAIRKPLFEKRRLIWTALPKRTGDHVFVLTFSSIVESAGEVLDVRRFRSVNVNGEPIEYPGAGEYGVSVELPVFVSTDWGISSQLQQAIQWIVGGVGFFLGLLGLPTLLRFFGKGNGA